MKTQSSLTNSAIKFHLSPLVAAGTTHIGIYLLQHHCYGFSLVVYVSDNIAHIHLATCALLYEYDTPYLRAEISLKFLWCFTLAT